MRVLEILWENIAKFLAIKYTTQIGYATRIGYAIGTK